MAEQRIVILGGYGATGRLLARLLLQHTEASIVIAGRRTACAEALAQELNATLGGRRASACFADATDEPSLRAAFAGATLVVIASTTPHYAQQVARAAIDTGADYLDYHFEQKTVALLKALEPAIAQAGRCCITQAGFHPGLPAALVRSAAPYVDRYQKAIVGMAMSARIEQAESIYELVDSFKDYNQTEVFKDGRWQRATAAMRQKFDLGSRFGVRACYPLWLEELRALPQLYGLNELGLYMAGFNWLVDYLIIPCVFLLQTIKPGLGRRQIASVLAWGMNRSAHRPGVAVRLLAEGTCEGTPVSLSLLLEHADPYLFTAIPVVACIQQYLDGSIRQPGLWLMGQQVQPARLLRSMEELGVAVDLQIRRP